MSTSETAPRTRRGNAEGSEPRQRKDGRWQANYPIGQRPDGSTILKSVYGKTKAECRTKARALAVQAAAGEVIPGKAPRLIEWMDYWLANIAPRTARPITIEGYRSKIDTHIRGHRVGRKTIDKLTPVDFDAIYTDMLKPKKQVPGKEAPRQTSAASAEGLHRVLRRALNMAVKRGVLAKNPILRVDSPRGEAFEAQVYTTDEVRSMLSLAMDMADGARWILNLTLGLRQGEALGLSWADVDFAEAKISVVREVYTLPWKHGCGVEADGSPVCGRRFGSNCKSRHSGGFFTGPPKSSAGKRTVPMPTQLVTALKEHREVQKLQRKAWAPYVDQTDASHELVFCRPNGQPLTKKSDWDAWKAFIAKAGVPDGRIHDGRHTAATTLLLLGIPPRVVMSILGWSQASMLTRYQHILDEMHQEVADKLTAHWSPEPPEDQSNVVSLADRLAARRAQNI
ncbi:tyrosine-type recombinase/integrase [Glutamicibacter ardleyensis]|uniref:tyrosine-type recombinase/integrase n=1 Tax=Glutamicibacter ardleyensis TaxID=225894 RepID=UPI003FD68AA0